MTRSEGEQISRIILRVFEHEDTIDPRTIAEMFRIIGNMTDDFETFSDES